MEPFTFDGSWNQIKGKLRQRFAQLTDADLEFIQGKGEELLGRLQTKLGLNHEELEALLEDIKAHLPAAKKAVLESFDRVKSATSDITGQIKNRAGSVADDFAAIASASIAEAEALAGETFAYAKESARTFVEYGEEQVRRKPRETLLVALAAGFVIGLLINKRSRD
ncbi:MAG: hypothetical protein WCD79_23660 [Chthoniobacteraceae bacterium]